MHNTLYGLVFGGFLLLGGRLSDLYGRKRVFLTGTGIFTLASLIAGFSDSAGMLVAFRGVQGLGAALLAPAALALLMGVFAEGPARNRAFGIWGTVAAAGYSIGVVLGGILTAFAGWRWIMFVNVPFGIAIFVAALRLLREPEGGAAKPKLDILGSVLVTGGLMVLVYALAEAPVVGWSALETWRLIGLAVLLLGAFVFVEMKTAEPLMPLRIFLFPGIAAANAICTFLSMALTAMNLMLTLYFQHVLHFSPFMTGLAFLPHGLAAIYAGPLGGKLATRFGPKRVLLCGLVLVLAAMGLLTLLSAERSVWLHVIPVTVLMSLGAMPAFVNLTLLATAGVKEEDHGLVSGMVNTTGQLGGALGLAVLIAVASGVTSRIREGMGSAIGGGTGGLPGGGPGEVEALLWGYRAAFGVGAAAVALALLIGWLGIKKAGAPAPGAAVLH